MLGSLSVSAARLLSSAINPLLIVLWLVGVGFAWRRGSHPALGRYALASIAGVIATYLVVHVFRWAHFWPSHPEFPSGHETFGASIGTSLALLNPKWLVVVLPLLGILTVALVGARYHDWFDIAGAVVVSPLLTWLCHLLLRERAAVKAS